VTAATQPMRPDRSPALPICIVLPAQLAVPLGPAIVAGVHARIAELCNRLGLTRGIDVAIAGADKSNAFAIDIGDSARGLAAARLFPRVAIATLAHDAMTEVAVAGDVGHSLIDQLWLLKPDSAALAAWCDAITLLVHDVVALRPHDLIDVADVRAVEERLGPLEAGASPTDRADMVALIIRMVVDEMVGVADHDRVAAVVARGLRCALTAPELAERMIDLLRDRSTRLRVHPEYIEDLLGEDLALSAIGAPAPPGSSLDQFFDELHVLMVQQTGLVGCPLELITDATLPPQRVALTVNDVARIEWRGPPTGKVLDRRSPAGDALARDALTGEATGRWSLRTSAHPRIHPFLPLAYSIHSLLSKLAVLLVDRTSILGQISDVQRLDPHLVAAVLGRYSLDQIVQVARALVRDGLTLRLQAVFESWVGENVVRAALRHRSCSCWSRSVSTKS
jgi:hypothetical protein